MNTTRGALSLATSSCGVVAGSRVASASSWMRSSSRSCPTTSWPCSIAARAMLAPMRPNPTIPNLIAQLLSASTVELDDGLDVVGPALERVGPAVEPDAPGDQPVQPPGVGTRHRLRRGVEVPPVGVDRAHHD